MPILIVPRPVTYQAVCDECGRKSLEEWESPELAIHSSSLAGWEHDDGMVFCPQHNSRNVPARSETEAG
jgi:hypothetical protein